MAEIAVVAAIFNLRKCLDPKCLSFPHFRSTTIKWLNKYIPLRKMAKYRTRTTVEFMIRIAHAIRILMCFQYSHMELEQTAIKSSHRSRIFTIDCLRFVNFFLSIWDKLPKRKHIYMAFNAHTHRHTHTHFEKGILLFRFFVFYCHLFEINWNFVVNATIPYYAMGDGWMEKLRTQNGRTEQINVKKKGH